MDLGNLILKKVVKHITSDLDIQLDKSWMAGKLFWEAHQTERSSIDILQQLHIALDGAC